MKKSETFFILVIAAGIVAILDHFSNGWDEYFGFQSSFLAVLFSVYGILAAAGAIGFWLIKPRAEKKQFSQCPNCGTKIETVFSREDKLVGGKNLICPQCNVLMWLSISTKKSHFFLRRTT